LGLKIDDQAFHASLFRTAVMERALGAEFIHGRTVVFSTAAPGSNGVNEDAVAVIACGPQSGILAVADGLGGGPEGEQASRIAVETLQEQVLQYQGDCDQLREVILSAIEVANEKIIALGGGAGTTLSVVELHGSWARTYHAGDSMVLVTGQRGKIKLQTVSHAPVSYAMEAGLLDESEAIGHSDRHLVSNVLGANDLRIEMGSKMRLAMKDTLLVASDGLWDNFYTEEIIERIRKGPLHKAAAGLVQESTQRMAHPRDGEPSKVDDLSFILYRL